MKVLCECGKEFDAKPSRIAAGRDKYCYKACMYKYRHRPSGLKYTIVQENKGWFKEGQRSPRYGKSKPYFDSSKGYMFISIYGRHLPYHRFVMEQYLGRELSEAEVVHHVDGNKLNNSIDNLELFPDKSSHIRHHQELRRER